MTISKVNPTGWPVLGTLTSAQLNQIDIDHVNAVDRSVAGDSIVGAISMAGAGASITCPNTTMTGAGSLLTTTSGGRIVLGDNDYPQYSAPRTFQRCLPFLVQQGSNLNWIVDGDGSTAQAYPGLQGTVDLSRTLIDGSILTAVDLYFYVGQAHTNPPAVMPQLALGIRGTSTSNPQSYQQVGMATPASGAAWYAAGGIQNFTLVPNTYSPSGVLISSGLAIDRANLTYFITIIDESGANSLTGNIYQSIRLTYTRTDMRPA